MSCFILKDSGLLLINKPQNGKPLIHQLCSCLPDFLKQPEFQQCVTEWNISTCTYPMHSLHRKYILLTQ